VALMAAVVPIQRGLPRQLETVWPVIVVVGVASAACLGLRRRVFAGWVFGFAFFAVPAAGFLSGLNSDVTASLLVAVPFAILIGLGPSVLRFVVETPRMIPLLASIYLLSQMVSVTVGLLQYQGLSVFGWAAVHGRIQGLAGHPNRFGIFCGFTVIILAYMWTKLKRPGARFICLTLAILNVIALVLSGSLSALLACIAGLLVMALVMGAAGIRAILVTAVLTLLAVATGGFGGLLIDLAASVQGRADQVQSAVGGASSLRVREGTYAYAWDYLGTDPIVGVGMDGSRAATFDGVTVVHNYLLHAWYQGGFLLLLTFVLLTIVMLVSMMRSYRTRDQALSSGLFAAGLVFAWTSAWFVDQFYWMPIIFGFALLAPKNLPGASLGRTLKKVAGK
jgi:O-antigen ligase